MYTELPQSIQVKDTNKIHYWENNVFESVHSSFLTANGQCDWRLTPENFNHFINFLSFLNEELDKIPRRSFLKHKTVVTIVDILTQCQRCCLGNPFLPFCLCLSIFVFLSSCVCVSLSFSPSFCLCACECVCVFDGMTSVWHRSILKSWTHER